MISTTCEAAGDAFAPVIEELDISLGDYETYYEHHDSHVHSDPDPSDEPHPSS